MEIQVWIEIRKGDIFHVIHIKGQKQVIHEFMFAFLRSRKSTLARWRPTLDELTLFSAYLKFLRGLCEMKVYPTSQQIDCILAENQLTVYDLFFRKKYGLYGQQSNPLKLEPEESEELFEMLIRPLNHCYMKSTDIHFFGARVPNARRARN